METTLFVQYPGRFIPARVKKGFRLFLATAFFMIGGFTSTVNLAIAKKATDKRKTRISALSRISQSGARGLALLRAKGKSVAKRIKAGGEFRLLNIYKRLLQEEPQKMAYLNSRTVGKASWYGGFFHGRKTAMGTTFNMNSMTAAHRTLPLGTWVRVTNLNNHESVVVQVTDRGPYVADRILDLSAGAAERIGYKSHGIGEVKMEILDPSLAKSHSPNGILFAGLEGRSENLNGATELVVASTGSQPGMLASLFAVLSPIPGPAVSLMSAFT